MNSGQKQPAQCLTQTNTHSEISTVHLQYRSPLPTPVYFELWQSSCCNRRLASRPCGFWGQSFPYQPSFMYVGLAKILRMVTF